MGFLKRVIKTKFRDGFQAQPHSSFEDITETQLEEHLAVARYGSFLLTDAVRPSFNLEVVPSAGVRRDVYRDQETSIDVPVLMASQTSERLFELFIDLLDPLGEEVDVVLETSHDVDVGTHDDLYREHIDLPILKSTLYDYEDLLMNDGCTGIAVLNPRIPMEVQFDEHKLLIMYGHDLAPFEEILADHRVPTSETIRFITEGEHVHSSSEEYARQLEELKYQLGVEQD
ncbi:MAG: hypothetical protein DWQ34_02105 [Planctomycetota bacterium]|nr:MAG: hypothetical protein DWQ29_24450 [Planctomycetota bacterium]REJ97468.1 MAG: hypothetical protein DWQ34_02105 [Planctomycetota bacterium]REK20980.1 MAG: hypothetical protein DWQ41_23335 [Planctomycetota bacterium]REK37238.1 MAG: hypothetical protein DWQ45_07245 [Planctomycetota bacterium]